VRSRRAAGEDEVGAPAAHGVAPSAIAASPDTSACDSVKLTPLNPNSIAA
jgi:hypothetical protein